MQHIVFARTNTGVLYADEKPLLRNCTSFLVTNSHLLVTTTNHLLKFLHITIGTGTRPLAQVHDLQFLI